MQIHGESMCIIAVLGNIGWNGWLLFAPLAMPGCTGWRRFAVIFHQRWFRSGWNSIPVFHCSCNWTCKRCADRLLSRRVV